ncbi:MAG: dihydropteroate synthase [Bdellovibrio sp.]|nr:dihydropteroate synthase [Bdellovibrio sp.]
MRSRTVALGLGSNLKNPIVNLRSALNELKKISEIKVLKVSSIYESDAQLPKNAGGDWNKKYLNAVVLCEMSDGLTANLLLEFVKEIEKKLGRDASEKWAPRVIDIDLLYWSAANYKDETLQIPHSHLTERPFALLPLLEVWPEAQLQNRPMWADAWILEKPFHTLKSKNFGWPEMVGILNITEDSFSDGGKFITPEQIQKQAIHLLDSGADIIDIGAESTRPGASPVTLEQETARLLAAFAYLGEIKKNRSFKISLDCRQADVIRKVLSKYEIDFLNDVTGFDSIAMQSILKESKLKAFVMHSLSIPPNADLTLDTDVNPCAQLMDWWQKKSTQLVQAGINREQLVFDPGIGFGKTKLQSMYILNHLEQFSAVQAEIMIGHSRKSFLTFFSDRRADQRDLETALITRDLNLAFTQYLRVHDIETQKISLRSSL